MTRKLYFLPAALLLGLAACNNGGDQAASTDSTKKAGSIPWLWTTRWIAARHNTFTEVPAGAKVYFKNLKTDRR